jgi:hypothetical protein
MYEFACHEGNFRIMEDMLSARADEGAAREEAATKRSK